DLEQVMPDVAAQTQERSPDDYDPLDMAAWMMKRDIASYLPEDLLQKVDKGSMHFGLETRAPLLDHRVVEFALGLPLTAKIHNGQSKVILRQVLSKYVPMHRRPKAGFGIPVATWLRGPLRQWAQELLCESTTAKLGLFEVGAVK